MTRLIWDNPSGPKYTSGVSQGVFFGKDGKGVAWSGLVGVTEKPQANAPTPIYNAAGTKYDIKGNVAEKKHALTCYIYPDAMDEYLGIEYLDDYGFQADERAPKPFHMAYRTETGNGHYEIHVLLSQIATFSDTARATLSTNATPSVLSMNLEGVPDPRFKSSHVILDSRLPITKSAEKLLFGDEFNDSDFNAFLTAEPVWETVAINYAPTIEPDYDNWVWLGGENLILNSDSRTLAANYASDIIENSQLGIIRVVKEGGWQAYTFYNSIMSTPSESFYTKGKTYTLSMQLRISSSNDGLVALRFDARKTGQSVSSESPRYGDTNGSWVNVQTSMTLDDDGYDQGLITIFSHSSNPLAIGDLVEYRHIKLEEGSVATPWTPAPSDTNQLPSIFEPTPENYKPGIVGGRYWDDRTSPSRYSRVFWDEDQKTAGIYSKAVVDPNKPTPAPAYVSLNNANGETIIPKQIDMKGSMLWENPDNYQSNQVHPNVQRGRMRLHYPAYNQNEIVPTVRGTHKVTARGVLDASGPQENNYVYIYAIGVVGSPVSYLRKVILTDSSYDGPFFDANSVPATKGDRYVRIPTPNGDATEHQQLRLRTTSNLVLRDITPFQYWIDAADSHLLLQGDTFTVSGPQVSMNGDLFTIDDSITGFSSDAN